MARVRLFAGLRELAGSAEVLVDASTLEGAIREVCERFGPGFAAGVERSRVWVNGEEVGPATTISETDEIAILPPVSGGAGPVTLSAPGAAAGVVAVAALLFNQIGGEPGWAALVVGVLGLWVADIAITVADRGRLLPSGPAMLSTMGAVLLTHRWGLAGVAAGVGLAVFLPMAWSVMSDSSRMLVILAPMVLVGLLGSVAAGSLVVAHRSTGFGEAGVKALVAGLMAGGIAGALGSRLHSPLGDPILAIGMVTLLTTVAAAFLFDLDVFVFLVMAAVVALAAVVGRGLGSIIRSGHTGLVETAPGLLAPLDGAVVAACVFLPVFRLLA